jgi:hypothetical protein
VPSVDSVGYQDLLRPVFAGRRVILAGGVAVGWTSTVPLVRSLGATDVLVIGTQGLGAGPLPDPAEAMVVALRGPETDSTMARIRTGLARLHAPPAEVVNAVRRFDPRREALVLGDFLGTAPRLDGRPFLAYRRPEWVALEDKTRVDIAAVRPVEMVTLRRDRGDGQRGLFYAGCATFFDPPLAVRARMRKIARLVGVALRADVDFRGAFTVDGVVVGDRFLPTELNPRMGAGLNAVARELPDLPLQLLMDTLVGGIDLGYVPAEFEADLVGATDAHRFGETWRAVSGAAVGSLVDVPLAFSDGIWRWALDGDPVAGTLTTGPDGNGTFVRCTFDPEVTPDGVSVGSRAVAFWDFADRELGTDVGPLRAASPER